MNDALFELYYLAESYGAPHQAFEKWAEKHFKPLNTIADFAKILLSSCREDDRDLHGILELERSIQDLEEKNEV